MKKINLLVCGLLMVVVLCLFTSCDDLEHEVDTKEKITTIEEKSNADDETEAKETEGQHDCSFGQWVVTQNATCTEQGEQERACACGNKETKTIDAMGHTEIVDESVAPTCTQTGLTEGKHCGVCNEVFTAQSVVQALGHQYGEGVVVTEATCTQDGTKTFACMVKGCSHSYTETYSLETYSATELYEQSVNFVGEIVTYDKNGYEYALGTCFVISSDGKVVTNYHVIEGAYSAQITIGDAKYDVSSVLAYDANIDLAVLKINATGLTAATICKSPVKVGSTVYAIGSSRGMTNTYSQGIVTYADRIVDGVSHVQHDASITHGNSGGPLINVYGEVIGINTWGISDSQNLNFAVFTDELDNLVYGTPITLSDLFSISDPYEYLAQWVLSNYSATYSQGKIYSVEETSGSFVYSLNYNIESQNLFIDVSDGNLYCSLFLNGDTTALYFYSENSSTYKIEGSINAAYFTNTTVLTNYSYDGPSYHKTSAVNLTQTAISTNIAWLSYFMLMNNIDVSISDLGFLAYN